MGRLLFVSTVLVLTSCSGDSSGPNTVATVEVTATSTTVRVGESAQLTATAFNASGSVVTGGTASWSTSSASLATVSPTGLVSALSTGQVTITASVSGVAGSLPLTVVTAGAAVVFMPGFSFVPFTTNIRVGGSVAFDFPAETHNVIFSRITGAPADIQATSNRSVSRTFTVAGNFPYDCTLHPGMSGLVVVSP